MELPDDEDFLYAEISRAIETVKTIGKQKADLVDQVTFWRMHYGHTLNKKPAMLKLIGLGAFDPRRHCSLCEADWKSLIRFRENMEEKRDE